MAQCTPNPGIPENCEFESRKDCKGIRSLPQPLPKAIAASDISFSFDGFGGCTKPAGDCSPNGGFSSQNVTTVEKALRWIEDYLVDIIQPCQIQNAPDCSFLTVENGKLATTTAMEAMQCIPFNAAGQVVKFNGSAPVIGFPEQPVTYTWLSLGDTGSSNAPINDYTGLAGGLPILNDAETALILQPCLPQSSICAGAENTLLVSVENPAGDVEVVWQLPVIATDSWLELADTTDTDYVDKARLVPVVNDAEDALTLGCVPVSSVCAGDENQIIQTLPDPADATALIPQWIDCLPVDSICPGNLNDFIQMVPTDPADLTSLVPTWVECLQPEYICPGTDGQALLSVDDGTGKVIPTWTTINLPDGWLGLSDTSPSDSYAGLTGLVPVVNEDEDGLTIGCVPVSSICEGADGEFLQTIDDPANAGTPIVVWQECLDPQYICPGTDGQTLVSIENVDGDVVPVWGAIALPDSWLGLSDTSPSDSYAGLTGLVPVVNEDEDGLTIGCVPESSICEGADGEFLQTIDDPANAGTPIVVWQDCLDPQYICPGTDGQALVSIENVDGDVVPVWTTISLPGSWLGLTDTSPSDSYAGLTGLVPVVNEDEDGLTIGCVPESSICEGADGEFLQTIDDPADPGTPIVVWKDCLDPQYICPGTNGQGLVSVQATDGTITPTWQAVGAAGTWLALTDTAPGAYTDLAGLVPVVNTAENGLTIKCVPASTICHGDENEILQVRPNETDGALEVQWVECLNPTVSICPSDDGCDRIVTRNGATRWLDDTYVNLCDVFPQPDPTNNQVDADVRVDSYAGFSGAISGRVRQPEEDGVEFVTQNDDANAPDQGQVLIHREDDAGEIQTHYETPVHFEQNYPNAGVFAFGANTVLDDGRNVISLLRSDAGGGIDANTGAGVTADLNNGYTINKSGNYQVCLTFALTMSAVDPLNAETTLFSTIDLAVNKAVGGFVRYKISEQTSMMGTDHAPNPVVSVHAGSGCVVTHLSAGDTIQIEVDINIAKDGAGLTYRPFIFGDGDIFAQTTLEGTGISISELNGFNPALVA